jgi:hypothetical protein
MVENKKKGNVVIVLVIFIIAIMSFITYMLNKPKSIFALSINSVYQDLLSFTKELENSKLLELAKDNTILMTSDLSFKIELPEVEGEIAEVLNLVNKIQFNMQYGEDNKNKRRIIELNSTIDTDNLFNVLFYSLDEKQYIYLKDIYDKYIQLDDVSYESIFQEKYITEIEYVLNKIKDLTIESLKDSDFTKTTAEITVDGEKINTNKVTFNLTEKRAKEIVIHVLTGIKSDEKWIDAIITIVNDSFAKTINGEELTKELLINKIEEGIEYFNDFDTTDDIIYISVYTKKWSNTPIQYEILHRDTNYLDEEVETSIKYLVYDNKEKNEVKEIIMKSDENDTKIVFQLIKEDKGKYKYKYTVDDNKLEESYIFSGEFINTKEETLYNKEFINDLFISMNINDTGKDLGTFSLDIKYTTKVGEELKTVNIGETVKYDQLTDEDLLIIYFGILDKLLSSVDYPLINLF